MRRFLPVVLALFALVLPLAACTQEGTDPPERTAPPATVDGLPTATGTHEQKLTAGPLDRRDYLVHVPPQLGKGDWERGKPVEPLPVVLAMHGGLSSAEQFRKLTGFDDIADEHGFLAVYPNGWLTTWNAGDCCGAAKLAKKDDVGFLDAIIDRLVDAGLADRERVHVTGFSNGAGMAYRMACERPGKVAAIGVVASALVTRCEPDRGVSAMIVHGTADGNVPYKGGGRRDINDSRGFPPVRDAVDFWRRAGGLSELNRRIEAGTKNTRCEATGRGARDVQVAFCTVEGGKHRWPDGMSAMLWDFFRDHPQK